MLTQRFTCNDHYSMAVKYMPAKSYYYAQVGTAGIKIGRRWRPQNRKNMVGRVGIEPTTIGLKDGSEPDLGVRSAQTSDNSVKFGCQLGCQIMPHRSSPRTICEQTDPFCPFPWSNLSLPV